MKPVMERHGLEGNPLVEGDLYFLFDGGKTANDLLKAFPHKDKVMKEFFWCTRNRRASWRGTTAGSRAWQQSS